MHTQIVEYLNFKLTRRPLSLDTQFFLFPLPFSSFVVSRFSAVFSSDITNYKWFYLKRPSQSWSINVRFISLSVYMFALHTLKCTPSMTFDFFGADFFACSLSSPPHVYKHRSCAFFVLFKLFILKFFYSICNAISKSQLLYAPWTIVTYHTLKCNRWIRHWVFNLCVCYFILGKWEREQKTETGTENGEKNRLRGYLRI